MSVRFPASHLIVDADASTVDETSSSSAPVDESDGSEELGSLMAWTSSAILMSLLRFFGRTVCVFDDSG